MATLDTLSTYDASTPPQPVKLNALKTDNNTYTVFSETSVNGVPVSTTTPLPVEDAAAVAALDQLVSAFQPSAPGTVTSGGATVAVSNFPASQAVTIAQLPLPAGAAQDSSLNIVNQSIESLQSSLSDHATDGALNTLSAAINALAQNLVSAISANTMDGPVSPASGSAQGAVLSIVPTLGFASMAIRAALATGNSVVVMNSWDAVGSVMEPAQLQYGGAQAQAITSDLVGTYRAACDAPYMALVLQRYSGSGQVNLVTQLKRAGLNPYAQVQDVLLESTIGTISDTALLSASGTGTIEAVLKGILANSSTYVSGGGSQTVVSSGGGQTVSSGGSQTVVSSGGSQTVVSSGGTQTVTSGGTQTVTSGGTQTVTPNVVTDEVSGQPVTDETSGQQVTADSGTGTAANSNTLQSDFDGSNLQSDFDNSILQAG